MSQAVKFSAHPITLETSASAVMLDGTLSQRADGKWTIKTAALPAPEIDGFLEVHGDGSYHTAPTDANFMAGATYIGWNLLEYPAESDRNDGLLHVTFLVAITTPV